jgi:alkanesulfonate monooxygenase SsuD/methylene tetrahydromethanopterin reductase-like flavin-dependent oxidoreductase (luciferase family)
VSRVACFINPGARLGDAVELARRADVLGYDSVWTTHGLGRDALLVLGAYGAVAPRVGLGTGVIPIYPRHPVLLAQEALTLADITGGRLRLGIGVSHVPAMRDALGLDMGEPLAVMQEYVAVLRGALTGRVKHEGARYRVSWQTTLSSPPAPPPIYLAALGTRMCELAGELADGVVLWLCAPEYIRTAVLPALRRGRERAGKSLEGFEVVAAVPAALTVDVAAGRALLAAELTRYLALPFYRAMLRKSGFGAELDAYDRAPAPERVGEKLIGALGAVGDYAALAAFVQEHRAAGVTLPAIRPIGMPDAVHYLPTLEAASGA